MKHDDELAILMILALIALTVLFEEIKHNLEHGRSESERLVVNALFGEVTVLGFIALITFFLIKSGFFEMISMRLYHEDMHVLHLFEDVHFGLFFTMMIYLCLVIWVLIVQVRTKDAWHELEEQTRKWMREKGLTHRSGAPSIKNSAVKPPSMPVPRDEYLEWRYNGGGRIPVGFAGVFKKKEDTSTLESAEMLGNDRVENGELHQYMLLRSRFIWGFKHGEGRKNSSVDLNFDFARYLENCLAQTLTEIVTVHVITWGVIAVSMVVTYIAITFAGDSLTGACYVFTLFGLVLVAAMIWLFVVVRRIQAKVSPPPDATLKQVLTGSRQATPAFDNLTPVKGMDKHEQLFPFRTGGAGPDFLEHFLRSTLLLAAVYMVGLLVVFLKPMSERGLLFLFPICFCCVLTVLGLVIPILGRLTVITSVGTLKRPDMIDETIREVKLERSIKTIKILAALQSQLKRLKKMQGSAQTARSIDSISPKQLADLQEAFKLFDEDGSGNIDSSELYNLLQNLGQHVDHAEAEQLLLQMDTGNDGHVSFEEFAVVMAEDDDAPVADPSALAKEMFQMLDRDGSGAITLREFREFLGGLPIDLAPDEVDTMLHDIFGDDDDASINEHEFEHFLTENKL